MRLIRLLVLCALPAFAGADGRISAIRSDVALQSGLRLSFLHWPAPERPALVLLHGKDSNAATFLTLAQRYSGRFDVYAIDLRGRGFSDWSPGQDYTVESTVRDVEEFARALRLTRFMVYGHAYGAVIAISYAAHFPQRVSLLVLEDGGPLAMPDGSQPPLNPGQAQYAGSPAPEPKPLQFSDWDSAQQWQRANCRDSCGDLLMESQFRRGPDGVAERMDRLGIWKSPRGPDFTNQWPLVAAIRAPTLLLRAERGLVPKAIAMAMQSSNSGLRTVDIAGAGHSARVDRPEAVYAAVDRFLKDQARAISR